MEESNNIQEAVNSTLGEIQTLETSMDKEEVDLILLEQEVEAGLEVEELK